jgi:phosphotriesterase-related protein
VPQITRREALALIGAGSIAASRDLCGLAARQERSSGPIIRTLVGDMAPERLGGGPVLFHEHLSMRFPFSATQHYTDDVDLMVEEVRAAARDGVRCIVDGGHDDMGRNLEALKRIATDGGVPIVASGGYYIQRWYPPELAAKSVDEIADDLVRDARTKRFGALGEIGQSAEMTDGERKVFQAVGKAHVRTGLPIFTHNAYTGVRASSVPRDSALRQLDVLEGAGVKPQSVAIGHVCCLDEPTAEIAKAVAKRGAFVGFDRVTIEAIIPDARRAAMLLALLDAGYADQVLLSSDFSSARSLKKNGGAGLAQAATVFAPMLVKAGASQAAVSRILDDNPRRFLAFRPV